MNASDDDGAGPAAGSDPGPAPAAAPIRKSHRTWVPAILAAGIVLGLWGPNLIRPPPQAWTAYISVKGQTRRVKLADRSILRLNGATAVKVEFEDHARHAAFEGGEAEFNIAANGRPFLTTAGDREIRTRYGDFNLRRYGRMDAPQAVLTVRRGAVEVGQIDGKDDGQTLAPGDQLSWTDNQAAQPVRKVDAQIAFAWQSHRLIYRQTPLKDVVIDLNRYVDRPISIAQPAIGDLPFTGVLTLDTEARMLARVQAVLPVQVQALPAEILLKARPSAPARACIGKACPRRPPPKPQ